MEKQMSLEKAVQENTEALNRLIAVIEAAGAVGVQGSDKAKVAHPAGKNAATPSTGEKQKAATAEPAAASPSEEAPALSYADIQNPFLRLVQSDRDAAVALLAELGVPSLKTFEKQPERFAELLAQIQKAGAK